MISVMTGEMDRRQVLMRVDGMGSGLHVESFIFEDFAVHSECK